MRIDSKHTHSEYSPILMRRCNVNLIYSIGSRFSHFKSNSHLDDRFDPARQQNIKFHVNCLSFYLHMDFQLKFDAHIAHLHFNWWFSRIYMVIQAMQPCTFLIEYVMAVNWWGHVLCLLGFFSPLLLLLLMPVFLICSQSVNVMKCK